MLEEFGCQEHKTTADGRFDIKVPEPSDKEALLISAASRDYLPADVLLESGGVEIDFILVAKASEATR